MGLPGAGAADDQDDVLVVERDPPLELEDEAVYQVQIDRETVIRIPRSPVQLAAESGNEPQRRRHSSSAG